MATFGSYAIEGSAAGPLTLVVFSVLGWVMVRYGYPVAATVVGLLLGSLLEANLLRTYQISGRTFEGAFEYAVSRPGALAIFALLGASIIASAVAKRKRRKAAEAEAARAG
jgi:putative tricarboxylic transport membrane protein